MMKKTIVWTFLSFIVISLLGCTGHDEQYFRVHPKALQDAIADCPAHAPKLISCQALHQIALKVNELVYELRMSPQGFGQKILSLQEKIKMNALNHQSDSNALLEKDKQELRERLAIVNWLESPTS